MDKVFVFSRNLISRILIFCIFLFFSCRGNKVDQFFEVKIDGVLWQAYPKKDSQRYNLQYKPLSHQLSILATATDGSRIEISFHAPNQLQIGKYPSTKNDYGIESGIFYFPEIKKSTKQMASITYELPVQENTVQITKIDKSNKNYYAIEGTFYANMFALYPNNSKKNMKFSNGRFKVLYFIDSYNLAF